MRLEISIKADGNGRPNTFVVTSDAYGVSVRSMEGGPSVTLDWNGTELKAIVYKSQTDEPVIVESWKPQQ